MARLVRRAFETLGGAEVVDRRRSIVDLIQSGKFHTVEFKSTARSNLKAEMPHAAMNMRSTGPSRRCSTARAAPCSSASTTAGR